ncbi:MAG: hypothetical protein KDD94_12460 [Calditrichaeota bacterium]|nr:hypothetical protein [Calditrichota bacterium]
MQVSILHQDTTGNVEIFHFTKSTEVQFNALYSDSNQHHIILSDSDWADFLETINSMNIINWSDREMVWQNRPEELEISFNSTENIIRKRINNGVEDKFDQLFSLLRTVAGDEFK